MNQLYPSNTRIIPYVIDLNPLTGNPITSILWTQLTYWFNFSETGFYKFLEAPQKDHPLYREGDSWTEELLISAKQFRYAFDKIGVRHTSKAAYEQAENPFMRDGKELYFCSYHDKIKRTTHYFKNHQLVNDALGDLGLLKSDNTAEKPQKKQLPKGKLPNVPKGSSTLYTKRPSENNNNSADLPTIEPIENQAVVVESVDLSVFTDSEKPAAEELPVSDQQENPAIVVESVDLAVFTGSEKPIAEELSVSDQQENPADVVESVDLAVFTDSEKPIAEELSVSDQQENRVIVVESVDLSVFTDSEKPMAEKLLVHLTVEQQIKALAVLVAMVHSSQINNKLGYLRALINSILTGSFTPAPKPKLAAPYHRCAKERALALAQQAPPVDNKAHFARLKQKCGDDSAIDDDEKHGPNTLSWQKMKRQLGVVFSR